MYDKTLFCAVVLQTENNKYQYTKYESINNLYLKYSLEFTVSYFDFLITILQPHKLYEYFLYLFLYFSLGVFFEFHWVLLIII